MSITCRIHDLLETELSKRLRFMFEIEENLSLPGSRVIRLGDRIRFSVVLGNHSSLPLISVSGTIRPTAVARFRRTPFELARLPAGEIGRVAVIEATISAEPGGGPIFDQIGHASVSATADMSGIEFHQWDKPLRYAMSAQDVRSPGLSTRGHEADPRRTAGALPLSRLP